MTVFELPTSMASSMIGSGTSQISSSRSLLYLTDATGEHRSAHSLVIIDKKKTAGIQTRSNSGVTAVFVYLDAFPLHPRGGSRKTTENTLARAHSGVLAVELIQFAVQRSQERYQQRLPADPCRTLQAKRCRERRDFRWK